MADNVCAILIDLDGTLSDSLSIMRICYRQFLEKFKKEATETEFLTLNGPPLREVVSQLKMTHDLPGTDTSLFASYQNLLSGLYLEIPPARGASEFLQKAKQYRCQIGIVTSNGKTISQTWVNRVGFSQWIDFFVTSDDVTQGKPHPEPYQKAIQQVSCGIENIIAIEDSALGALSALQSGLKTFVLANPIQKSAFPQNAYLVETFQQLQAEFWPEFS